MADDDCAIINDVCAITVLNDDDEDVWLPITQFLFGIGRCFHVVRIQPHVDEMEWTMRALLDILQTSRPRKIT